VKVKGKNTPCPSTDRPCWKTREKEYNVPWRIKDENGGGKKLKGSVSFTRKREAQGSRTVILDREISKSEIEEYVEKLGGILRVSYKATGNYLRCGADGTEQSR